MESYKLFRLISRKNKEGKVYYLAIVILSTDIDCDIVRVCIRDENQAKALLQALKDPNFDISKYLSVKYNTYQKKYEPSISYGL